MILLSILLLGFLLQYIKMDKVVVITSSNVGDSKVKKLRIKSDEIVFTGQLFAYVALQLQVEQQRLHLDWMNPRSGKYETINGSNDTVNIDFQTAYLLVSYKLNESTVSEPLLIENRLYNFESGFDIFNSITNISTTIYLNEIQDADKGTGLKLWDSSIILSKYMEKNINLIQGKRILELGCGIGSLGLSLSCLGATTVMLTDLEYTMANLDHNVRSNRLNNVQTAVLNWAEPKTYPVMEFDIIVAADVVWLEGLVPSLVMCMHTLALRNPTTIYLSHQTRSKYTDELLFQLLNEHFNVLEVPQATYHVDYKSHKIKIFEITLK